MKHVLLTALLLIMAWLLSHNSVAQIDTISLTTNDLITENLKPGKHQYLIYFGNTKKKKLTGFQIWNRNVSFVKKDGVDLIEIKQHWYSNDTTFNRYVYTTCRKKDFSTIYHKTSMAKSGTEAFNFTSSQMVGADSVASNAKKDLKVDLDASTLNWELDMEIFSTLPYKREGQRFIINFYHPGGKTPPKYYEYAVVGSDKIQVADGKEADCWKLKIDYAANSWAIFWVSKKSREVLKMQESWGSGFRYKVRFSTPVDLTSL